MLRDEAFQNGHQIVVADEGGAGAVDVLGLDVAAGIQYQLAGKAHAAGIRLRVIVAVHHVERVVGQGLGEHDGLLSFGQVDGLGQHHVAVKLGKAVKVHQDIAVGVQVVQDLAELRGGDEIAVVFAAQRFIRESPGRVRHQHMEAQIGDHGGILMLNQLVLDGGVFGSLGGQTRIVIQIAVGFQHGNGSGIVVTGSQLGSLVQNLLLLRLGQVRGGLGLVQVALLVLLVDPLLLNQVGDGADDKGQHQNQAYAGDDGGQVNLLEDLGFGFSPASAGAAGILGLLRQLSGQGRSKVQVIEFGEDVGAGRLAFLLRALPGRTFAGGRVLLLVHGPVCKILRLCFLGVLCVHVHFNLLGLFGLRKIHVVFKFLSILGEIRILRRVIILCVFIGILPGVPAAAQIQKIVQIHVRVEVVIVICVRLKIRVLLHIVRFLILRVRIAQIDTIQIQSVQVQPVLRGIFGYGLLRLGAQSQFLIGEFRKVNIVIVFLGIQKRFGIKAVFIFKIELTVEIVLTHCASLPLWYNQ